MVCECVFCIMFEELAVEEMRRDMLPNPCNKGPGPSVVLNFCDCLICVMLVELNVVELRKQYRELEIETVSNSSSITVYESARSCGFHGSMIDQLILEESREISGFNLVIEDFKRLFFKNKRLFSSIALGMIILMVFCLFFFLTRETQITDEAVNNTTSSFAPTTTIQQTPTTQQTTNTSTHTVPTQQATKSTGLVQTFKHTNDDFSVTFTQQTTQFEPNDRISSTKTPTTQRTTTKFDVDGISNRI